MYASVKFFDPTVILTSPLAGLDWIRFAELPDVPPVVSPPPPQAAIPTANIAATTNMNAARTPRRLITLLLPFSV
jgi:hypothetical protein